MSRDRKKLGRSGEALARKHLERGGYQILAQNYRCSLGEIDLIGYGDGCIVFVEVKTRRDDASTNPEENVTRAKRRQLELVARTWLAQHRRPECAYRFDVVSVVMPDEGEPRVRHIVEAFQPGASRFAD